MDWRVFKRARRSLYNFNLFGIAFLSYDSIPEGPRQGYPFILVVCLILA